MKTLHGQHSFANEFVDKNVELCKTFFNDCRCVKKVSAHTPYAHSHFHCGPTSTGEKDRIYTIHHREQPVRYGVSRNKPIKILRKDKI